MQNCLLSIPPTRNCGTCTYNVPCIVSFALSLQTKAIACKNAPTEWQNSFGTLTFHRWPWKAVGVSSASWQVQCFGIIYLFYKFREHTDSPHQFAQMCWAGKNLRNIWTIDRNLQVDERKVNKPFQFFKTKCCSFKDNTRSLSTHAAYLGCVSCQPLQIGISYCTAGSAVQCC